MYEKLYFGSSGSAKPFARGLRKRMTDAEAILWEVLRNRRLKGLKFRRQHVIEGYIADFYCLEKGVVIEVDGGYHLDIEQRMYDDARTVRLNELGLKVIRVTNDEVCNHLDDTLGKILSELS